MVLVNLFKFCVSFDLLKNLCENVLMINMLNIFNL